MGEKVKERPSRTKEYTMAKYMLIMRATEESFANFMSADFTEVLEAMGKFNDELIRAGVVLESCWRPKVSTMQITASWSTSRVRRRS